MVTEFESALSNILDSLEVKIGQKVAFQKLEPKSGREISLNSAEPLDANSRQFAVEAQAGGLRGYLLWKNALKIEHHTAVKAAASIIGNALCYYHKKADQDNQKHDKKSEIAFNITLEEEKVEKEEASKNRSSDVNDIVLKFCDHFEEIRRKPAEDKWVSHGAKDKFKHRIQQFVTENKPIYVIVPSFPYKSKNKTEKTLTDYPDMAEYLSIKKLTEWCKSVDAFYPPGVRMIIFSDGRFYNDHFGIPDDKVTIYQKAVENLHASKYVKWLHLDDFLPEEIFDHTQKRAALDALYGVGMDHVEKLIKEDENVRLVYAGFKFWIEEELGGFPENIKTTNAKRRFCSNFAKIMLQRNQVYSKFLVDLFPCVIRLSIHSHNNTDKIGIHLFGDDNTSCGTPWHNVAVLRRTGKWEFMKKKEAEMMRFKLCGRALPEVTENDYLHYVETTD